MNRILFLMAALVFTLSARADVVKTDVIRALGVAKTYRGAVNDALVSALEQHDGITVSNREELGKGQNADSESVSVNGKVDEKSLLKINESISQSMQKWASGRIRRYEVLSHREVQGKWEVEVAAYFAGAYEVGLPEGNRRRLAVVPFRITTGDTLIWYGQAESSGAWARQFGDKLSDQLVQSRKFTMLDREFDAEVNAELARLKAENASAADVVRLCQKLGTDYLVVGNVRFVSVPAPGVNPLTGQALPARAQLFAEISYRVLLAPTGQLKWADTIRVDSLSFAANSVQEYMSASAEGVARGVADGILSNLLPFEVVGQNDVGEILVGEGGKSLFVGERLTVFALGKEVVDTRTGEVLDQVETPIGDVEVVRVSAKISYAKVLGGDPKKMVVGSRLRRPKAEPVPTPVQGPSGAGVVVPF